MDNSLALFLSVLFISISIFNTNNRINDLEKEIEKIKELTSYCEVIENEKIFISN